MKQPMLDAPAAEWLVYGDALQVAGDPRGELIGLVHAVAEGRATAEERDAHVAKHAGALLGDAGQHLGSYGLGWRHCVLDRIEVRVHAGADAVALVEAILRSPVASELRELALVGIPEHRKPVDLKTAMLMLARLAPPNLRSFAFIDRRAEHASMLVSQDLNPRPNLVSFGSFAPFFAIADELRIVTADSLQLELANIVAPQLRGFTLECLRFTEWDTAVPMCERLAGATWPMLERFACRLVESWEANIPLETNPYVSMYETRWLEDDEETGEPRYNRYEEADEGDTAGVDWQVMRGLLENLAKCPLQRLALTSFQSASSLIEALTAAGLPAGLELDLSDSALGVRELDAMLGNATLLKSIKKLAIHRVAVADSELAERIPWFEKRGVVLEGSHRGSDARYRYVMGQE